MKFFFKQFKSQLRLIVAPLPQTKTATVLVMVGTGSRFETKKDNGVSHFLEHMFFKGTRRRPSTLAIASELDAVGAAFNAFTSKEYTGYWVKASADKIALAFDVVSDMLLHSLFASREIQSEKKVILEELNMYLDNPLYYLEDLFESCLYGDNPAGWDIIGTEKTIKALTRRQLLAYYRSQYGAQNTFVCVAGGVNTKIVQQLTAKYFKNFPVSQPRPKFIISQPSQTKPRLKIKYKKTDQAHIALGVRAYPYGHKFEFALRVLAAILGGAMSSRLFISLRERQGLAYYVRTGAEFYTDSGYLSTQAGVNTGNLQKAIKIILTEYKRLAAQPVGRRELKRSKDLLCGRAVLHFEASDNLAQWYGRQAVRRLELGQKLMDIDGYLAAIRAVSSSQIRRLAEKIFVNSNLNLAIIGPYQNQAGIKKYLSF